MARISTPERGNPVKSCVICGQRFSHYENILENVMTFELQREWSFDNFVKLLKVAETIRTRNPSIEMTLSNLSEAFLFHPKHTLLLDAA